jgi:uncharacterized protein YjdB
MTTPTEGAVGRRRGARAGLLLLGGLLTGCGGEAMGPEPPHPAAVTISPAPASFASLGQEVQFTAAVTDQHGQPMSDVALTWTSSDPAILTHEGSGRFRSVANGQATVTARTPGTDGVTGTAPVTVAQVAAGVTLTRTAATLWALGQTEQWTARVADALDVALTPAPTLTWTSSNPAIASVTAGLVTAVADGTAQITATTGSVSASLPLDVAATVPYTLCVNLTLGTGPGPEVCTTLSITVHVP